MNTTYRLKHIPGHSAYDHLAKEIIARVEASGLKSKKALERACIRGAKEILGRPVIGPRIEVVR